MSEPRKTTTILTTTLTSYVIDEWLGDGGSGTVFGGVALDRAPVAVKVLSAVKEADKERRFRNEIAFLRRNRHPNIVTAIDYGVGFGKKSSPFYLMKRYDCNLRHLIKTGIAPTDILTMFAQIMEGVEAAHRQNVTHRDLKPENILCTHQMGTLAVGDFGIARFPDDDVATLIDTGPRQRLANFQYAAPEQRIPGEEASMPADIYALGLILNEMFTGAVPQGTAYRLIGSITEELKFLDRIVARMIRQDPDKRIGSIAELKEAIQRSQPQGSERRRLIASSNAATGRGRTVRKKKSVGYSTS